VNSPRLRSGNELNIMLLLTPGTMKQNNQVPGIGYALKMIKNIALTVYGSALYSKHSEDNILHS
jgi:hypothetical protein